MRYSGLCVGGPRAGQMMSCQTQRLRVAIAPELAFVRRDAQAEVRYEVFHYAWTRGIMQGTSDLVTGFWVPEEHVDQRDTGYASRWAIQQLVKCYQQRHASQRRPTNYAK